MEKDELFKEIDLIQVFGRNDGDIVEQGNLI